MQRDQERVQEGAMKVSRNHWSQPFLSRDEQRGKSVIVELELVVLQVSEDLSHPNPS